MATKNSSVTRKSVIAKAMEMEGWNRDELEVLGKMLASLEKPRKKSAEPTKTQLMNANLADALVKAMAEYGEPVTAKWICECIPGIASPQKAVAVAKAAGERVVRFYEGRQAYYKLA